MIYKTKGEIPFHDGLRNASKEQLIEIIHNLTDDHYLEIEALYESLKTKSDTIKKLRGDKE